MINECRDGRADHAVTLVGYVIDHKEEFMLALSNNLVGGSGDYVGILISAWRTMLAEFSLVLLTSRHIIDML